MLKNECWVISWDIMMMGNNDDYVKDIEDENDSLRSQLADVQEELDERKKNDCEVVDPNNLTGLDTGGWVISPGGTNVKIGVGVGSSTISNGSYITYSDSAISARYPEYIDTKINIKNGITVYDDDEQVLVSINDIKKLKAWVDRKSWLQRIKDRWAKITKKNLKEDVKS